MEAMKEYEEDFTKRQGGGEIHEAAECTLLRELREQARGWQMRKDNGDQ